MKLEKKAGISALCEYSILSDNAYPTYAVTKKELKDSGVKVEKQVSELEEIGCVVLELGYFIDFLGKDVYKRQGYGKASRSFNRIWKERDSAQPRLLEAILYKDNFNRAYKRVKANKGALGIDGMTIEEALPYQKEHQREITCLLYTSRCV